MNENAHMVLLLLFSGGTTIVCFDRLMTGYYGRQKCKGVIRWYQGGGCDGVVLKIYIREFKICGSSLEYEKYS